MPLHTNNYTGSNKNKDWVTVKISNKNQECLSSVLLFFKHNILLMFRSVHLIFFVFIVHFIALGQNMWHPEHFHLILLETWSVWRVLSLNVSHPFFFMLTFNILSTASHFGLSCIQNEHEFVSVKGIIFWFLRFPCEAQSCPQCSLLSTDKEDTCTEIHWFDFSRCFPVKYCLPHKGSFFFLHQSL